MYCNHLINCPGCLLKVWTLRAGAYLRLGAYYNLVTLRKCWTFNVQHFLNVGSLFCYKTINNNKSQRCTKAEDISDKRLCTWNFEENSCILIDYQTMNLDIVKWRKIMKTPLNSLVSAFFVLWERGYVFIRGWVVNRMIFYTCCGSILFLV